MPQLPVINRTCDTVGVIQPSVSMTTSLQMRVKSVNPARHYNQSNIWRLMEGPHLRLVIVNYSDRIVQPVGITYISIFKRNKASICEFMW